ncbi:MAG: zinc-ribbon domain-containing protein, partial [Gemmataceae bacterium]|nr:zinc-ribbon domain-containing protein [Gemmataceae bacterium]
MTRLISCPQCQASLKLPPTLAPDAAVTCARCRLKFVPPQPVAAAGTGAASRFLWIALALALGAGGGAFGWHWIVSQQEATHEDKKEPAVAQVQQTGEEPSAKSAPPESAPAKSTAVSNPLPKPGGAAPIELPDPPPMPKKPPPKT